MLDYNSMLGVAVEEAIKSFNEGGIPIGAALFDSNGKLLGKGHNRRVQDNDAAMHAETSAFKNAGRQKSYADKIMVTTLAPCFYCSGLIRQFKIGTVLVGENSNFAGGIEELEKIGVKVINLHSKTCENLLKNYIQQNKDVWYEDIGENVTLTEAIEY